MDRKILALVMLLFFVTGCAGLPDTAPGPQALPTATPIVPTPTSVPTSTPTDTPTVTPLAPTSTPAATATPSPTLTPTTSAVPLPPTPTPTPGVEGRFVFQVSSGGDIYVVNADGTSLRRLTQGMDPSWSPDGSQVVFARWTEPWGICAINADGSNERVLFSSNVARAPVWSPDGSQIAFYFETEGWALPEIEFPEGEHWRFLPRRLETEWHIGVVLVVDGYLHQPNCERYSFSPSWSADGQRIVYDGDHGLSTTTVQGDDNHTLTDNVHDHFPVWSPDGTRIAFMYWQHDHWEIFATGADGLGRWPLTSSSPLLDRRPNNVSPAWSPDGGQIAFLSDRTGQWEFYVMDADGSDQRQILEDVTRTLKIWYTGGNERVLSWVR